ncbi:MAG: hypothetical protein V8T87_07295 [Victivallales bacterium]
MKKLSVLILALCLNSLFAADTQKIPQAIMHPAEFQNHQFNICENFPGVLYFLAWNGPWKRGNCGLTCRISCALTAHPISGAQN